jgi:hypothetical protein
MQTTGFAEFLRLRQLGYPRGTRGFPSSDCSEFGFIGNVGFWLTLIPLGAISMPKGIGGLNLLSFKDLFKN